ncbi:MAG: NAD(P)-dependent oxidoreductase [Chitinophagaceae bacterium]|nr:NAD(P)-dependent oxidoreductase [Chitinophagaceae bacterium]
MKVAVTGSNGFIGKALVKELKRQENEVCVLVRTAAAQNTKAIMYHSSLLECTHELSQWQPDVFFHLAWRGVDGAHRNSEENNQYNYQLGIDSVQLAKQTGCKQWMGTGSQAEYGVLNKEITEEEICAPVTEYGIAKQRLYKETVQLCSSYNITHTWARIFSVYGPGDHSETFISYLINCMIQQKAPEVSSCTQQWDYLFIDDAAAALCSLIQHEGVYNIASGNTVELKHVVETIAQLTNYTGPVRWGIKQDAPLCYLCGSIQKIKNETDWTPKYSLKEGLTKTIAHHHLTV